METIKSLRQKGYKIRINHSRIVKYEDGVEELVSLYDIRKNKWQNLIQPLGGMTKINLITPDGRNNFEIETKCSLKDHFARKIGNAIAIGRLMKKINKFESMVLK